MADLPLDAEAFNQLNLEQKALLDTIDGLRNVGVGEIVNLPQIIVVGDQSSGKSSVLEAISRVRFPVRGEVCTRFATELVLRKAAQVKISVTIQPRNLGSGAGQRGPRDERPAFNQTSFSKDELPLLVEKAKNLMGIRDGTAGFSEDVLRVEISGPDLQSLTLVDLPGFYHSPTADQSPEGISIVSRLVGRYMEQKNSIILLVLSAKSDVASQVVLIEAKKHDPAGERTMGIVTKPDEVAHGAPEAKYIQLVNNEEKANILKHGWHVLRNRNSEENGENAEGSRISDDDRDKNEERFLDSGVWADLPANVKGVAALRRKLSKALTKHVHLSLPSVIRDIEENLEARREALDRLGAPRSKESELRRYLLDIANGLRDLTRAAVKGTYDDNFFSDLQMTVDATGDDLHDPRRLRAVVRNLNRAFDTAISTKGSRLKILGGASSFIFSTTLDMPLSAWVDLYRIAEPVPILFSTLKATLEKKASKAQGTEFPGSSNDRLALELFRDQAQRWKDIAATHVELVSRAARTFMELALKHVTGADEATRDAISRELVSPFFDEKTARLKEKVRELLRHYQHGDAICLEDEFRRELSSLTRERVAATQLNDALRPNPPDKAKGFEDTSVRAGLGAPDTHVSEFGLERVVDMAMTYYKMSLRTFTDNVIILAVENCLISELPNLLTSIMVHEMDKDMVLKLAAESADTTAERKELQRKVEVLVEGLCICRKYRPNELAPLPLVGLSATSSSPSGARSHPSISGSQGIFATPASKQPPTTSLFGSVLFPSRANSGGNIAMNSSSPANTNNGTSPALPHIKDASSSADGALKATSSSRTENGTAASSSLFNIPITSTARTPIPALFGSNSTTGGSHTSSIFAPKDAAARSDADSSTAGKSPGSSLFSPPKSRAFGD